VFKAWNATVYDVGIIKSKTVREYKLWHQAEFTLGTLGYALLNDTNTIINLIYATLMASAL